MTSYAESLSVCLKAAGAPDDLIAPEFLDCLTTMPFGSTYLELAPAEAGVFLASGPNVDPHGGIDLALKAVGWTAFEWHAPTDLALDAAAGEALSILNEAVQRFGPVLAGPLEMSNAEASQGFAGDYVAVQALHNDKVVLAGSTDEPVTVRMDLSEFMARWQAERIVYKRGSYTLRARFEERDGVPKRTVFARAIPLIRAKLSVDPGGTRLYGADGPRVFGGADALRRLAQDLSEDRITDAQRTDLAEKTLPLAADRRRRGAAFFGEAVKPKASANLAHQAAYYDELARSVNLVDDERKQAAQLAVELAGLEDSLLFDLR